MPAEIRVEGLAEVRRGLRALEPAAVKQFRADLVPIVRKVADRARSKVPSRTGRAAASIKSGVSGNNAYVSGGKGTVPYYPWLDFGGRSPRSGQPRSVGPWARSGAGPARGRFIFPAVDQDRDEIRTAAVEAVEKAQREVMGGT